MTNKHRLLVAIFFVIGALIALGLIVRGLSDRADNAEKKADTAVSAVTELANQVRQLGGQPVVEPSELPKTGPQGDVGPEGPQGPPGPAGPAGPQGEPGTDGTTGPTGAPGASVTGPAGPSGPAGPAGKDGKDGADGAPGPAGPAGYPTSFELQVVGGQTLTCTDPDGDHNYTCSPGNP